MDLWTCPTPLKVDVTKVSFIIAGGKPLSVAALETSKLFIFYMIFTPTYLGATLETFSTDLSS